jgi:hypothetical protein
MISDSYIHQLAVGAVCCEPLSLYFEIFACYPDENSKLSASTRAADDFFNHFRDLNECASGPCLKKSG